MSRTRAIVPGATQRTVSAFPERTRETVAMLTPSLRAISIWLTLLSFLPFMCVDLSLSMILVNRRENAANPLPCPSRAQGRYRANDDAVFLPPVCVFAHCGQHHLECGAFHGLDVQFPFQRVQGGNPL